MTPKSHQKVSKIRSWGHLGETCPHKGVQGCPGVPPDQKKLPKQTQKLRKIVLKATETPIKKIVIVAPVQPTTETAANKIVVVAPLQPATETTVQKLWRAAPLQPADKNKNTLNSLFFRQGRA